MKQKGNNWIIGLNMMDNYYTIFDEEKNRVGFQLKATASERMKELHTNESAFIFNRTKTVAKESEKATTFGEMISSDNTNLMLRDSHYLDLDDQPEDSNESSWQFIETV